MYYYVFEFLSILLGEKNYNEEDEDEEFISGIGYMIDKLFCNGRWYVDSGFVYDLIDIKTDNYYYVKVYVWFFMNIDFFYNVLVVLLVKSGVVVYVLCDFCKVLVFGRCSYVVVVLFLLVDYVYKYGIIIIISCISKECTWNKGKKRKKIS